jgi:hypothetical protein
MIVVFFISIAGITLRKHFDRPHAKLLVLIYSESGTEFLTFSMYVESGGYKETSSHLAQRTAISRYCQGRTSFHTFFGGLKLYQQYVYEYLESKEAA